MNVDLFNGSACPRQGLLSPGQDTKTCSTPMLSLTPIFISWHQSQHQIMLPSFQLTLFTLSAVCILPILTAAAPTRVSRGSHQPPSAIPISGALRVYPLQIRDSQDRSRGRLAAEIKGQVIVAPVDPSRTGFASHVIHHHLQRQQPLLGGPCLLSHCPPLLSPVNSLLAALPVNRNLLTFRTARGHFSNEPFGMHHSVRGSLRTFHFGKSGSLAVNSGADDGLSDDSAIITMQ